MHKTYKEVIYDCEQQQKSTFEIISILLVIILTRVKTYI